MLACDSAVSAGVISNVCLCFSALFPRSIQQFQLTNAYEPSSSVIIPLQDSVQHFEAAHIYTASVSHSAAPIGQIALLDLRSRSATIRIQAMPAKRSAVSFFRKDEGEDYEASRTARKVAYCFGPIL